MKPDIGLKLGWVLLVVMMLTHQVNADEWLRVRHINDGDTVILTDGRHLRYLGINTPEIDYKRHRAQPYAYAARRYNRKMVDDKNIRLEFGKKKTDRYGRVLAYVFLEDATFVNRRLLNKGYGYFLPSAQPGKYDDVLLKAQREAIAGEKGIWKNWREPEKINFYLGNRRSRRFHLIDCPSAKKISRKNRIRLKTMREAFSKGFAPAKGCIDDQLGWRVHNSFR